MNIYTNRSITMCILRNLRKKLRVVVGNSLDQSLSAVRQEVVQSRVPVALQVNLIGIRPHFDSYQRDENVQRCVQLKRNGEKTSIHIYI